MQLSFPPNTARVFAFYLCVACDSFLHVNQCSDIFKKIPLYEVDFNSHDGRKPNSAGSPIPAPTQNPSQRATKSVTFITCTHVFYKPKASHIV